MRVANSLKTTPFHARTAPLVLGQAWRRWSGYAVASTYDWLHDREYAADPQRRRALRCLAALQVPRHRSRCRAAARPHGHAQCAQARRSARSVHHLVRRARQGHRRRHREPARPRVFPPHFGRADPALPVSERSRPRRRDRRDHRVAGRARAAGPAVARHPRTGSPRLRSTRSNTSASRRIALRVSTSRSRAPATPGDLGYEIWVPAAQALPVWDALMSAGAEYGIDARGHLGARHGAHRGRADHARRRLPLRAPRADRRAEVLAVRALAGLVGRTWTRKSFNGQRALQSREGERGHRGASSASRSTGIRSRRCTSRVKLAAALPTVAWRTSTPLYRDGTQIGYATSGVLVAAPQEIPRARARRRRRISHRIRRSRWRSRSSISASAPTPGCARLPFFDPERKKRDDARRTTRYDAIIIGGGHNGLVARGVSRARGQEGVVLERRHADRRRGGQRGDLPGLHVLGLLVRREPAAPGDHSRSRAAAARPAHPAAREHGHAAGQRRLPRAAGAIPTRSRRELARHSPRDAEASDEFGQLMHHMAMAVRPLLGMMPPDPTSLAPARSQRHAEARQALPRSRRRAGSTRCYKLHDDELGGLSRRVVRVRAR